MGSSCQKASSNWSSTSKLKREEGKGLVCTREIWTSRRVGGNGPILSDVGRSSHHARDLYVQESKAGREEEGSKSGRREGRARTDNAHQ